MLQNPQLSPTAAPSCQVAPRGTAAAGYSPYCQLAARGEASCKAPDSRTAPPAPAQHCRAQSPAAGTRSGLGEIGFSPCRSHLERSNPEVLKATVAGVGWHRLPGKAWPGNAAWRPRGFEGGWPELPNLRMWKGKERLAVKVRNPRPGRAAFSSWRCCRLPEQIAQGRFLMLGICECH